MDVIAKTAVGAACALAALLLLIAASASAAVSLLTGGLLGGSDQQTPALFSNQAALQCEASGAIHGAGFNVDAEQAANAAVIERVAYSDGLPAQVVVIALATALQESGLRNLPYGDQDSLGLFQQRPSQGWGSPAQIMNPAHAAGQFYNHLVRVPDWWNLPLWKAAQAVQGSAYPTAYQRWAPEAAALQAFLAANPEGPQCR